MLLKSFGLGAQTISTIGQGTGKGGPQARRALYDVSYERLLRMGIDQGMTLIDTAEEYGMGAAEEVVGSAVRGVRDKIFIATKLSSEHSSRENVVFAAEQSLKRLKTDYIDLYQIHWPNPSVPIEETIGAMISLVHQGKVRYLGVCNMPQDLLERAHVASGETKISSVQAEYNLFDRSSEEEFFPFCHKNHISFLAYSPLDQGRLVNGGRQRALIEELASTYDKTPAQVILRWLIGQESVFVIPHTDSERHLLENAAAADFDLSEEDVRRIDVICGTEEVRVAAGNICVPWEQGQKELQTREDAALNRMNFVPAPSELAESIHAGAQIKPIRVRRSSPGQNANYEFELVEGKLRYWAWVLAFGDDVEIPALIREQ
jgi:diketogulonate reductase-like aldo/keto reductase